MQNVCWDKDRKSRALFLFFFVIVGIALVLYIGNNPASQSQPAGSVTKTIHYRFHIRNNGNQPVFDSCFSTHAPLLNTGTQSCIQIDTSHPYTLTVDANGNRRLQFPFEAFPPYGSKIVSIRATLTMNPIPSPTLDSDPSQQLTWTKNPENLRNLRDLALQLKSDTPYQTASNLFGWIVENVNYTGYSADAKGADYAFAKKQGDCTEFADLFVALARFAGLPARRISGYLVPVSGRLTSANYHDWAEFFDSGVWRIADAQLKNLDNHYTTYIAMTTHNSSLSQEPDGLFHQFSIKGKKMTATMGS